IGCGSGGISHWFGSAGPMGWEVAAVDIEDVRLIRDGYSFQRVADTRLPYPDETFDIVVTNHVIEHVGDEASQRSHLEEVRRVLRHDGCAYLAVPNKWMVVEPHFRLAFLSWLPLWIAHIYVRWSRKGTHYDCRPLTSRHAEKLISEARFKWEQKAGCALKLTFELEDPESWLYRGFLRNIPDAVYARIRRVFPTLIYILRPR